MVSFKVRDYSIENNGNFVRVFDIIVECKKISSERYYYILNGVTHGSFPIFLEVGYFETPYDAFKMVKCIEKKYPNLFEHGKNVDYICDMDFYPEFSAKAVKEMFPNY